MKIVNKGKFWTRIMEMWIIFGTFILTSKAITYANIWRGIKAYGGEYLIPCLGLLIIIVVETIYEKSEKRRK